MNSVRWKILETNIGMIETSQLNFFRASCMSDKISLKNKPSNTY